MNRDVASFFNGGTSTEKEKTPRSAAPAEPAVEPLLKPERLAYLAFQRTVLDWRDNAHAEILSAMVTLHREFTRYIHYQLDDMGVFRGWFADPADEVLAPEFAQQIQAPMSACLRRQEAALNAIAAKEASGQENLVHFRTVELATGCACLTGLDFKPSAHKAMIEKLHAKLLGTNGIAPDLCNQATHLATQMIQERHAC